MNINVDRYNNTPKCILRRSCIDFITREFNPGNFVEFGPGRGYLTSVFLEKGFYGICYDIGEKTRQVLRRNLNKYQDRIIVAESLSDIKQSRYDYLLAFEVLEHVEDDIKILNAWSQFLKQGGRVVISVPAHKHKFSKEDQYVGHIRRYDKADLLDMLRKAGFTDIKIYNYGFPLGNISRIMSKIIYSLSSGADNYSTQERSIMSGVRRNKIIEFVSLGFNDSILLPFCLLQKMFYNLDIGDGYVATAIKNME